MRPNKQPNPTRQAVEIAVHLGLIVLIFAWCLQILMPFIAFIMWGAVIAISAYRPFRGLRDRVGSRLALALFLVFGLGIILIPAWMFTGSILESAQAFAQNVEKGDFELKPPDERVQEWPLVGERLYAAWSEAALDLEAFLEHYSGQLKAIAGFTLSKVTDIGLTFLMLVLSILIAAVMLANDEASVAMMRRLANRLAGRERSDELLSLTCATIRSVTIGVLGIAFIQAVVLGAGMGFVGVPATGLWALLVLVLAIAQLPTMLVMLPVILYVYSVKTTSVATVFAVYSVLGCMSDMALKPLLLGRGVHAPMLVILLGAIGGIFLYGILGLFVGAVVVALGYKLYVAWLELEPSDDREVPGGIEG